MSKSSSGTQGASSFKNPPLAPLDEYNIKLLDNVKPADWQDPEPGNEKYWYFKFHIKIFNITYNRYNLVVIGAGSGGLVTAAGAAGT